MDANEKFLDKLSNGKIKVAANGKVGVIEQTLGGQTIFREPVSDVITYLSKAVIEQNYLPSSLNTFFTQSIWPIQFVKNGLKDKFYETAVLTAQAGDPYSDMTIEDLAQVAEIVAEETFVLDTTDINQYDYQIHDAVVADFSTSAENAVNVIRTQANAKWRSFGKANQAKVVQCIIDNVTETIETGGMTIEEKQKEIDQTFTKYASESENLITETINGVDFKFDTQFDQNEFVGIFNKNFSAEYKIDLNRNSFQIGENSGVKFDLHKIVVRDFTRTYGFPGYIDEAETLEIANVEILFVHKDAIDNIGHFELSKLLGTLKAYTKGRDYMKNNAFKVKGFPIIMFYNTPAAPEPEPATLKT